jgi:hypothetical protein
MVVKQYRDNERDNIVIMKASVERSGVSTYCFYGLPGTDESGYREFVVGL